MTTTTQRPFRFGVVAPVRTDVAAWQEQVRRIADHGYSTLLMPDVPRWQPSPAVALAVAASITDLRVGTWVSAVPFRAPSMLAWEAHSLSVLTGDRFQLGLGTGRPGIEDTVRELGLPVTAPGQRVNQVRETIASLRELDGSARRTPVAMAVRGSKALALAAELADTVTFPLLPDEPASALERLVGEFRAVAGERDAERPVELAMHVPVVGDSVAAFMAPPGTDPSALRANGSYLALPDDPSAAVEQIQRRRDELGFSYFVFGADVAELLAPVVAQLSGR